MRYFPVAFVLVLVGLASTRTLKAATVEPVFSQAGAEAVLVEPGTPRAWALLACSVLFERNGDRHDLLGGDPVGPDAAAEAKKLLEDWWDIKTQDHLLQQLLWLDHEGHRKEFVDMFKAVEGLSDREFEKRSAAADEEERLRLSALRKHAARVKRLKSGLLGWDYARLVALCRWGYAAGYLSEEEAWKRMNEAVAILQKSYASWEELGEVYCIARDCWNPGPNEETWKAFEKLKTEESSPWRTTEWKLKLTPLEKPPKASKK